MWVNEDWRFNEPPQPDQEEIEMNERINYSTAICLVSDEVRGVGCSFELDHNGDPVQIHTYKNLNLGLKVGDLVVVPTKNKDSSRHGFTVVRVEELDLEIDIDDTTEYKWIAGKFDHATYDELLGYEKKLVSTIKGAEKRRRREELKESVMEHVKKDELPAIPFSGTSSDNDDIAAKPSSDGGDNGSSSE